MQKLILTSAGFENKKVEEKFLELAKLPAEKIKVIFIPTAAITPEAKAILPFCKADLMNAGILEENILTYDLDRIMSSHEICRYDAIYVCGGDTRYLLKRMNEAEFNTSLKSFLDNGGIYIGVSAGTIVMANNLPNNMGYIDCSVKVHCQEGTKSGPYDKDHCPDINLTDNQAIVIDGDDIKIIV